MADNINQNNPWEGYFERRDQERMQALQQQREQIENERKIQAQRLLANKTGAELAKVLSIINPNLSVLGTVLGTTTEFAKQAYQALDEMSAKLSEVNASAKLLGVNIEGLKGASEMHKDILRAQTVWRSFIDKIEEDIGWLYNIIQQEDKTAGMDKSELLKDSILTNFGTAFSAVLSPINPLAGIGGTLGFGVKQEQIYEELDKRVEKEKEVNQKLEEYADALGGVSGADTSLVKQLINIQDNLTATQNELIGYASTGVTSLAGAGVSSEVDQNRWTSLMLGYTEKIFRDMEGSVGFNDIYQDVLNFFVGGKTEGLNKYGYGLTEESFYGYAQQYENMFLGDTKYREDKMIETRFNYFDTWINSTDELKESMYDLGYEVKNNTNALQKWQWLESINSISTEKGSSDYKDYFAVDQDGNIITDSVFGTELERLEAELKASGKALSLDQVIAKNEQLGLNGMSSKALSLDQVIAMNDLLGNSGTNSKALSLDQVVAQNELLGLTDGSRKALSLDQVVAQNELFGKQQNVQVYVSASDNLKVEIEKSVTKNLWDALKDSFQKDIQTLPERLGNIF